ncbi:MAG: C40 family peptidase [Chromatiaceae bacterium]|jgi:cell wall-associated NlpC family hydrolase
MRTSNNLRPLSVPTLVMLLTLLLGACASPPGDRAPRVTSVDDRRVAVVDVATRQIGTPYRYGGNRPGGFDCSGLVQFAHGRVGIEVPRTTAGQWRSASPLDRDHLLPGDVLFFEIGGTKSRHVGIYEGSGRFIHAPSSGKPVGRASLDNPYWRSRWVASRTFI